MKKAANTAKAVKAAKAAPQPVVKTEPPVVTETEQAATETAQAGEVVKAEQPLVNQSLPFEKGDDDAETLTRINVLATKNDDEDGVDDDEEDMEFKRGLLTDFIAPYIDTYPEEKEFHITSDSQVFLHRNRFDAIAHQKQLDKEIEVFVYIV